MRQSFSFTSYPLQQVLRVPFSRRFSLLTTSQRGDHRIRLWTNNRILEEGKNSAVNIMARGKFERCHTYVGHSSTVVSCDWRVRGNQRQIVSWSTDRHLSLWQVHESHLNTQGENREASKRPDNVVIQTASPKVEALKGFAFGRNSDGFTLSAKKYNRKSLGANSLKDDADEAEDDVMVTIDKLDEDDFSLASTTTERKKTFGSLLSFRNAHQEDDVKRDGGIMNILRMTSKEEKSKPPTLSLASSSDTRHRPCPPCGT